MGASYRHNAHPNAGVMVHLRMKPAFTAPTRSRETLWAASCDGKCSADARFGGHRFDHLKFALLSR